MAWGGRVKSTGNRWSAVSLPVGGMGRPFKHIPKSPEILVAAQTSPPQTKAVVNEVLKHSMGVENLDLCSPVGIRRAGGGIWDPYHQSAACSTWTPYSIKGCASPAPVCRKARFPSHITCKQLPKEVSPNAVLIQIFYIMGTSAKDIVLTE